jgi:protein-tyrosine phosphatase
VSDPTRIDMVFDLGRIQGVARHGNTPFDCPLITHIDGNLWTGGCRDQRYLPTTIEHVISLYPWERYNFQPGHEPKSASYHWLYDSDDVEQLARVEAIVAWGVACVKDGPTLIHCQAGLNRSSMIAGRVLIALGRSPEDAVALLREKRSPAVLCNQTFLAHVLAA